MISENDVKHIASLARIHLEQDEIKKLTKDLESILQYVTKLEKLDVSNVEPTSHAIEFKNVFREDKVTPSLKQEEVMKIAVEHHKGSFKVPKVIE